MGFLSFFRGSGAPPARLDHARFTTFIGLDIGELLASITLSVVGALMLWGAKIPEPAHIIMTAYPVIWAALLFVFKVDDLPLVGWLGRMLPFWYRQRRFTAVRPAIRSSASAETIELALASGENLISWELRRGPDGLAELHIYEHPLRPYRGLIAARGRRDQFPGIRSAWRRD